MIYIIYKISIADQCYIGSTKDFKQRKQGHRDVCTHDSRNNHYLKIYETIRANGGWDKAEMIPIEEFECEGQLQARIREEYWRREYNAQLNLKRAYITKEQHEELLHKNDVLRRSIKVACDCGGKYMLPHKTTHENTKKHQEYLKKNVAVIHNE